MERNSVQSHTGVALVGIGMTEFSRSSGRSVLSLACEAALKAIQDSGLELNEIDGIGTYALADSVDPLLVARSLGLPPTVYYMNFSGGANTVMMTMSSAIAAISTGQARNVVVFRALNGRSGRRLGGTGMKAYVSARGDAQFIVPYGYLSWTQRVALRCRRHMIKYGTTSDDLAAVALMQRRHAILNQRATMRAPLDLNDYYRSPIVSDPLRVLDCCLETDAGGAIVFTSLERARDLRHKPVIVRAVGSAAAGMMSTTDYAGFLDSSEHHFGEFLAASLYQRVGITASDIDLSQLYDCYTISVIETLESFGFCGKGEAGDFVREGRASLGGQMPVNTHGGQLSEGYLHTMNLIVEAAEQLRGLSGDRQVPNARLALVTSGASACGGAMILGTE